ncbi:RHS repeat-associated core domain-containing protein [Actinoplanes sp. NPDC051494]|uniref:RHS repeat-associated core domain-containing protein n=1 Tax=Actinoplanes sp. NPDC051494 TaxID=3363907 RepID=UPI00378A1DF0
MTIPPRSTVIAAVLPFTVVAGMLANPAAPAVAAPAPATTTACPPSAADEAAALISARLCGGNVAIAGATTETSTAVALPTGQVEQTISAAPVRVRRGAGWVPVDLDLVRNADGTVSPKAAPSDLVLSGAQATDTAHQLAAVGVGDNRMSIGWTGALGAPVIEGSRATYPDVMPGVDLQVQATRTGAETFFVVESPEAATRLDGVQLPVTGVKVASHRVDKAGNTTLLNAAGTPLATVPAPEMWDAGTEAGTDGPAETAKVPAGITRKKSGRSTGVTVTVGTDDAFFTDPATEYPVVVDPQVNPLYTTFDTYVKQGDTVDRGGANDLQLGLVSGDIARSFVHWDSTKLAGKQITAATVNFYNFWSQVCTATSWEIWSTGPASSDTRWGSQPAWKTKEATSTATKGSTSCADGWVAVSGTSFFQRAATAGQSRAYMGIRATSETDGNAFKQFRSRNADISAQVPYAVVTYNSYPVVGARSTAPATSCVTGTGRPYVSSATPTLKTVVTDGEASPVKGVFEWYNAAGTKIGGATTASAASGATLSTVVPSGAFANGSTYKWRVQGNDGTVGGAWSGYCEFTVDTTAPAAAPTVSSSTYPAGGTGGSTGTAGTFSFGSNGVTDVAAFLYGFDVNPPATAVNATSVGGSASVSITPATAGSHTLYVRSRDRAGNLSAIKAHTFTVDSRIGEVSSPEDGDLSAGKVLLAGKGAGTTTGVTYQWRRAETDAWLTVPAADVTRVSGSGAVTWPLATTGAGGFPGLTWNTETTVNAAEAGPDALDGPLQVRASFTGGTAGTSNTVDFSLDRNRAGAPTADLGPGEVNLLTGNLTIGATDAETAAGLGVTRVLNTREAGAPDPLFGTGWVSGTIVTTADTFRALTVTGSLVQVGTPDGDTFDFTKKATTSTGASFTPQLGSEEYRLEYLSSGPGYLLTDAQGNVTTFTRGGTDPAGVFSPTSSAAVGTGDTTAVSWEKVTVGGTDIVRPTRAIAPAPSGVDCRTAPATTTGCKSLTFGYGTTATAGDYPGRVKELAYTAFDPAKNAMVTTVLARYSYDSAGRLASAWDPRLDFNGGQHLATGYTYGADGLLATITPPAEEPWRLAYTTVPGDPGKGRLANVSRSALSAGTATSTVVYRVPLTGTGAPMDMAAGQTARWGQNVAPVDATAVFPATQVPDGDQASGTTPTDYRQATVTYLDGNAREVDTMDPGWHVSATWYDIFGNETQHLTARALEQALWTSDTDSATTEAALASALSTVTRYTADGSRATDTFGPEHDVSLSDWSVVRGRNHTAFRYDEGAKDADTRYDLVTSRTESVQHWTAAGVSAEAGSRTTATRYDWDLRQPVAVVVDPQGLALTSSTEYDSAGQVVTTTTPAGDGTTAATMTYAYYRAGTGSGHDECDNHPEWAGLLCRTAPAAQPGSDPEIPESFTEYTMSGQPSGTVEKNSGGVVRRSTTTYDAAGRAVTVSITGGSTSGEQVSTQRSVYDPATGAPARTEQVDASGTVTAVISRSYDTLGRVTGYVDAGGNTASATYDIASRTRTVSDGKGTRTIGYDDTGDGHGLPNQIVDSQAGTFTASYDANGNVTSENWPNGLSVYHYYDEQGAQTGVQYLRGSTTVYGNYAGYGADAKVRWTSSDLADSSYGYDAAGRLTTASLNTATSGCVVRDYTFDKASNRTGQVTHDPAADGGCQDGTAGRTRTWSYDTADRVDDAGYTYDDLGRTLTLPGADARGGADASLTYYTNDMARSITQGGEVTTKTLDVLTTRYSAYSTTAAGVTTTTGNHYADDSDNPAWISEGSVWSRTVSGASGVAATYSSATGRLEWMITDLHGDVVATTADPAAGLTATYVYDEYGNPVTGGTGPRYGYLGEAQRSADNTAELITMGVRLYNPGTGRFLSVDPVYGGNANAYEYCTADPVNCRDFDGRYSYSYSYVVGYNPFISSKKVMTEWKNHFQSYFPFPNNCKKLVKGKICKLTGAGPVKVQDIWGNGFRFQSMPGHVEGANKLITFSLTRKYGVHWLSVVASGPNTTWCNKNKACRAANYAAAWASWAALAGNLGYIL